MGWLNRLESGVLEEVVRPVIKIPLSGEPSEVKRRVTAYGDFFHINNRWYASSSRNTHARLANNPEEWAHYHTLYRELRESWTVVPFQEEIRWLSQSERAGLVVGDFGCGAVRNLSQRIPRGPSAFHPSCWPPNPGSRCATRPRRAPRSLTD